MTNEELVCLIKSGNNEKMADLYKQNTGLINRIVKKYAGYEDAEDLRQEAFIGLCNAVQLYDLGYETAFSTYAAYWIKQACMHYIETCSGVIRIPSHQRQRIARYRKSLSQFEMSFGRAPSPAELMAALEVDAQQLEQIKKDAAALSVKSMSDPVGDESDQDSVTLGDTIADSIDHIEAVTDQVQNEQLAAVLWSLVDALETDEAAVIRAKYIDGLQYEQIAQRCGLSCASRARNISTKAMNKLRNNGRTKLKPYYDELSVMSYQCTGLQYFKNHRTSSPERAVLMMGSKIVQYK